MITDSMIISYIVSQLDASVPSIHWALMREQYNNYCMITIYGILLDDWLWSERMNRLIMQSLIRDECRRSLPRAASRANLVTPGGRGPGILLYSVVTLDPYCQHQTTTPLSSETPFYVSIYPSLRQTLDTEPTVAASYPPGWQTGLSAYPL